MYYPMTDYIALALIISFLFLTLFICLLCLKHERIKKETIRQKNAHILDHGWNATEFSWFRYGQSNGLRYALSYLAKQDQKEHGIILMRSRLPEKSNRGRPRHN